MSARFRNSARRGDRTPGERASRLRQEDEIIWRTGVAQRLRSIMAVAELRNVDVAKSLDVTEQRVSNWVNNCATPSPYQIMRFCKRYGISADYLLSGDVSCLRVKWAADLERVAKDKTEAARVAEMID
jgi:plasmid maintenance system antidote protein VapI